MALDIRPRVVFHTSLGAVVTVLDPATPFGGVIQIPGVGNVPYDVDWLGPTMTVHLPTYGDQVIPLIPTGGPSSFSIPGLGDVTYEVVFGPVDIPPEQLAPTSALTLGFNPWIIGAAVVAVVLLWPKRNPPRTRTIRVHLRHGLNNSLCGRGSSKFATLTTDPTQVTCPACLALMRQSNPKWDVGERVEFRRTHRRLTLPPHRHLNPCPCGLP